MRLVTIGGLIGLAGALLAARGMSVLLYDVSSTDPLTFLLTPLVLATVAAAAAFLSANRATAVDPMIALRE